MRSGRMGSWCLRRLVGAAGRGDGRRPPVAVVAGFYHRAQARPPARRSVPAAARAPRPTPGPRPRAPVDRLRGLPPGGREVLGQQLGVRLGGGELLRGQRRRAAPPRPRHHLGDLEAGGVLGDDRLRQQVEERRRGRRPAGSAGRRRRAPAGRSRRPGPPRRGAARPPRGAPRPSARRGRRSARSASAGQSTSASASARRPATASSPSASPAFSPPYRPMRPAVSGARDEHARAEARERLHDVGRRRAVAGDDDRGAGDLDAEVEQAGEHAPAARSGRGRRPPRPGRRRRCRAAGRWRRPRRPRASAPPPRMSVTAAVSATLRMMDSSTGRTPGRSVTTSTASSGACRRVERSFTRVPHARELGEVRRLLLGLLARGGCAVAPDGVHLVGAGQRGDHRRDAPVAHRRLGEHAQPLEVEARALDRAPDEAHDLQAREAVVAGVAVEVGGHGFILPAALAREPLGRAGERWPPAAVSAEDATRDGVHAGSAPGAGPAILDLRAGGKEASVKERVHSTSARTRRPRGGARRAAGRRPGRRAHARAGGRGGPRRRPARRLPRPARLAHDRHRRHLRPRGAGARRRPRLPRRHRRRRDQLRRSSSTPRTATSARTTPSTGSTAPPGRPATSPPGTRPSPASPRGSAAPCTTARASSP